MAMRLGLMAILGFVLLTTTLAKSAKAQTLMIGPGGVQYNGYGQGYYGGYGQGYRSYGRVYRPRVDSYTVYGNGAYGYGSGTQYQFPANGYYGNGNYNGYTAPGFYQQSYPRAYSPYGYSYYSNGY